MSRRVLVLGGGIVGLACAFEAAGRGFAVTVIEPGRPGGQASGAAAGMLAPYAENGDRPDPFFLLCLESFRLYPDWLRRIEEAAGAECPAIGWTSSGSLTLAFHEADLLPLRARTEWQNRYGAAAQLVDRTELMRLEPGLTAAAAGGVICPGECHVQAPALVAALEAACRRSGVTIAAGTGIVTGLRAAGAAGPASSAPAVTVDTAHGGSFRGDRAVVCAGAWSGSYAEWLGISIPVHPIRGQIISYATAGGEMRHMVFSPQAYWVAKGNGTIVCGASEDAAGFDASVTERGIGRLQRCSARTFAFLKERPPLHSWAGLRPATADGRPLLGPVPGRPQIVMAAGHYRNGILLAPATAKAVCGLLEGRTDALRTPLGAFAPGRFAPSGTAAAYEAYDPMARRAVR